MDLLVTYDVDTTTRAGQRRLRRVAKICEGYGQRVQYSVFEVVCSDIERLKLTAALTDAISTETDNIRIYKLPQGALDNVEHLGITTHLDHRGPLVI
ncbi:CRISPR-associated endonuclease Cas2 [Phytomonospora sp. NPDC050363]|uniref:CRISPR-associated endonuclease Cas2 n=1 Tax=Phytomonospora sp. NPDC050363 TaxID=3155642 RepID=UPI0033C39C2B